MQRLINNMKHHLKLFCNLKIFDTLLKFHLHCNNNLSLSTSPHHTGKKHLNFFYKFWRDKFLNLNISEPKESIENILAHVLGSKKVSDVYKNLNLVLNDEQINKIGEMCQQRMQNMPIQYVIGDWDFRDLTLKMKPPVFIPRPETELLVDIIISDLKYGNESAEILEICCGSGAISLSILYSCPQVKITAIDQSIEACQLTAENAGMHQLENRLTVRQAKLTDDNRLREITGNFNIIVSNPPYVPTAAIIHLQPEIKLYEDLNALDGGEDGLSLIRLILRVASEKLTLGGRLYLETDPSQPAVIAQIITDNSDLNLKYLKTYKDFCNKDRFVKIEKV